MRPMINHLLAVLRRSAEVLAWAHLELHMDSLHRLEVQALEADQLARRPAAVRRAVRPAQEEQHGVPAVHGAMVLHPDERRELELVTRLGANLFDVIAHRACSCCRHRLQAIDAAQRRQLRAVCDEVVRVLRVAEAVAELVDGVASVEPVRSSGISRGWIGTHPHICHGHARELLWIPGHWQPSTWGCALQRGPEQSQSLQPRQGNQPTGWPQSWDYT
ncbi:Os02g0752250 [Oryza sativa Japonica Group]|uniref:Os02g0752250 protein n=1 Tax=Oryza sativa subsp. japonica TaxID=39947 RepID=A0A0P0VPV4_ORYSJ|nr:hypothetical protein EE612_013730 [Oryza sativa]BAS80958.1 Os02g0752250 [Oryza sativa Japonica Group]